jgi:hypothetical protein
MRLFSRRTQSVYLTDINPRRSHNGTYFTTHPKKSPSRQTVSHWFLFIMLHSSSLVVTMLTICMPLQCLARAQSSPTIATRHRTHKLSGPPHHSEPQHYLSVIFHPQLQEDPTVMTPILVNTIDPRWLTTDHRPMNLHVDTISSALILSSSGILGPTPFLHMDAPPIPPTPYAEPAARTDLAESTIDVQTEFGATLDRNQPKRSSKNIRCSFCPKTFDRKSRAQACENRHKGISGYPCAGSCGDISWYVQGSIHLTMLDYALFDSSWLI